MSEKSGFDFYLEKVESITKEIWEKERENIFKAAEIIANSLAKSGPLHVFGCAHSSLLVQEIFYRSGLVQINLILAIPLTMVESVTDSIWFEPLEELAIQILDKYQTNLSGIMLIISILERNSVPIEMALEAKKRGLKVIAITSLAYSKAVKSRHSSERNLFELADVVIDNRTIPGDAIVNINGVTTKVGPTSLVIGSAILHALIVRVIEIIANKGLQPLLWYLMNMPGGDEANT